MLSFSTTELVIPPRLNSRILILQKCPLLPEEILSINGALFALDIALSKYTALNPHMRLNLVFTEFNTVNIYSVKSGLLGIQFNLAVYFIKHWRENKLDQFMMALTIIEEFCHYFWLIHDEILVLDKAREILDVLIPSDDVRQAIDQRIQDMKEVRRRGYPDH